MNRTPHTPLDRTRALLAAGLAALLIATTASGQTPNPDTVRRLQEENAALRKRLAELEGVAAPTASATQTTTTTTTTSQIPVEPAGPRTRLELEKDVQALSPFEVRGEKDYGYLRTNTSTATRIGMAIQKVPLSVSVISEDFIKDTGMKDIGDVLRYQGSAAGDNRMGVLQPATSFTPSGNISLRGFPINSRLRNGMARYNNYTFDNVERVEVIKGPAAIFFGMAFPGGVINYITKKPSFSEVPSTFSYSYGGSGVYWGSTRGTIDHNAVLSDKAAFRVFAAVDNYLGDARFEFQQGYSVSPSIEFRPLPDINLRILVEGEITRRKRNESDESWRWDQGWFDAYANPTPALIAAAGLSTNANPVEAYRNRIRTNIGNWIADVRTSTGNPTLALWRNLDRGAYITNRAGQRVHDEQFNYYGPGTYSDEETSSLSVTTEAQPFTWLDVRHNVTLEQTRYTETKSTASPNADGITWNTEGGILARDYIPDITTNQLDLVLKHDFAAVKNKLLFGGLHRETFVKYTGTQPHTNIFPNYGYLPGAYDKPDEGYVSPIPAAFRHPTTGWGYPLQFVRDRNGKIITPYQIFREYDPAVQPFPDIRRITEVDRGLVDRGRQKRDEWYINYQGTALDDRLTVMAGYRKEKQKSVGQILTVNSPWFEVSNSPYEIPLADWTMYGLSSFSLPSRYEGDSKMGGASFEIAKDISVYASYSETYLPNTVTNLAGGYDQAVARQRAISLGLNPDTELARIASQGGNNAPVHEKGKNTEFGVKFNLNDSKIVSTVSVYRLDRANRLLDDSARQTSEPLNWTGPGLTGSYNRILRWYSNDALARSEGLELETVWTPVRNYQAFFSASWMWKAKVLADASINPTSAIAPIYFGERMPYAPKYRAALQQKYTFTDGAVRGLTLGLGARYSSTINISTSDMNFNPRNGGLTAGDYLVFDGSVSYPFEVFGYKMRTSLRGTNLLDEEYIEGSYSLAPSRTWWLSVDMTF